MLIGICTYGTPVSSTLRELWDNKYKLIELNRLFIERGENKNALSWFVSKTLKMLPAPLVIASYADTSINHCGIIYQSTNWTYTGLSIPFKDYYVKGMEHLHNGTIMDMSRGRENRIEWLRQKFGEDLIMVERARKHRYFYFLGSKIQKKDMRGMLPYDVLPYPKIQKSMYEENHNISGTQTQLF